MSQLYATPVCLLLLLPPSPVLHRFRQKKNVEKNRTTNEELPSRQEYDTVCLFADVSGFTTLSEAMMVSSEGVEGLARHLNSYFGQMVRIIASEGGDVFKVCVCVFFFHVCFSCLTP